jgi:aspartate kinase
MQQVWKDVDGVLTCDLTVCTNAIPLPNLTFDEAVELGLFGALVFPGFFFLFPLVVLWIMA